jgi:hypothetical protein
MRPGAYPRVEHPKSASLRLTLALPTIIILGWKSLPGKNNLSLLVTDEKSFITLGQLHKILKSAIYDLSQ